MALRVENAGHKKQQRLVQIFPKNEKFINKWLHEWSCGFDERKNTIWPCCEIFYDSRWKTPTNGSLFEADAASNLEWTQRRYIELLNQFIDEVKGEIEAWSERGSGWIMDKILEAFINLATYQPLRGGSYMVLPTKLKNKKAILNIQR